MKPIKTLGLAASVALMAMAFASAPSAMAESTALCMADESPCSTSNSVMHLHQESVGKAKLLSTFNVECNVLFLGEVGVSGAPQIIKGNFTYTNCGSCSVEEVSGSSVLEVLKEGHEKARVVGEGEVHVSCSGFNCYYNGENLLGVAKGPLLSGQENGEVSLTEQETHKVKGALCPGTAKLDLVTTPLNTTYITNYATGSTTALCTADESPCSVSNLITHVHEESVGKAKLVSSITVECNALFLGKVGALGALQIIEGNFTYTNCGSCSVEEVSGSSVLEVLKEGHETARVTGEGEVHVNCSGLNCYYNGEGLQVLGRGPLLSGQQNGEVLVKEQKTHKVKGLFCPNTAKLDIVTTPLVATYITE